MSLRPPGSVHALYPERAVLNSVVDAQEHRHRRAKTTLKLPQAVRNVTGPRVLHFPRCWTARFVQVSCVRPMESRNWCVASSGDRVSLIRYDASRRLCLSGSVQRSVKRSVTCQIQPCLRLAIVCRSSFQVIRGRGTRGGSISFDDQPMGGRLG